MSQGHKSKPKTFLRLKSTSFILSIISLRLGVVGAKRAEESNWERTIDWKIVSELSVGFCFLIVSMVLMPRAIYCRMHLTYEFGKIGFGRSKGLENYTL